MARAWAVLLVAAFLLPACNKSGLVAGQEEADPTATPTSPPEYDPNTPQYLGRTFWAVDLDNIYEPPVDDWPGNDAAGAQFAVAVSNPQAGAADVRIYDVAGEVQAKVIAPGGLEIFELPRADIDGTTLVPNAYRIESDVPVSAHQFNPLGNVMVYSNDASLLIPVTALGTRYRVMSWKQCTETIMPGFVTVAAVLEGTTEVTITVTAPTKGNGDIPALSAGQSYTRLLQQYDVLSLETNGIHYDLTGSLVEADRPIAVYGGSECANVPYEVSACDHLEEQMIPIAAWGRTYVAAKSKPRGTEPDIWRIMASVDGTTITTTPVQPGTPATINAGNFIEIRSKESFVVTAGEPVLVGQYLVGQDYGFFGTEAGETGDPAMILSAPVEQYRLEYLFLTPPNYAHDSITVIAPTGTAVELDGNPIAASSFVETSPGSGWSTAQVSVSDGVHRLKAPVPVGLTVTGYDQYVSYGYPGGMNLVPLD